MMNSTRTRTFEQSKKHPLSHVTEHKMDIQGTRLRALDKITAQGKQACKEKKMALLMDVDRLKKKLRDEENIHRALQRAFNRPLGSLPRLPPYLPQNMLELVAEIAVLEEEVVRLEEQVLTCRQNLQQDAISLNSQSKLQSPIKNTERKLESPMKSAEQKSVTRTTSASSDVLSDRSSVSLDKTSSTSSDITFDQITQTAIDSPGVRNGYAKGKPNQTQCNSTRNTDAVFRCTVRSLMNGKTGLTDTSFSRKCSEKGNGQVHPFELDSPRHMPVSERRIPRLKAPKPRSFSNVELYL